MIGTNKRKNRTNASRATRTKPPGPVDRIVLDGVYSNQRFMNAAASLVGCIVQVLTAGGTIYEGIFRAFSHQFDIVLELAHKVDRGQQKLPSKDAILEKFIIKTLDVVHLTAANVDVDYATKDNFATDAAISKFNGQVAERELQPWEGASAEGEDLPSLDTENANGWDVNDMFRTNEQQYGVQSTFDQSLAGYTVPLERKNTDEYKKIEAKASKLASEIESSPSYRARIAAENGDEENQFSAVIRPDNSAMVGKSGDRYVPPAKRKSQQMGGKMTRISPSSQQQQNSHTNMAVKSHTPPGHPQHVTHSPQTPHSGSLPPPGSSSSAGPPLPHNVHTTPHGQPPPPLVQHTSQGGLPPHPQTHYGPPPQQPSPMVVANMSSSSGPHPMQPLPPHHLAASQAVKMAAGDASKVNDEAKLNGEKLGKEDKKLGSSSDSQVNDSRNGDCSSKVPVNEAPPVAHISNKVDRQNLKPKARDEQIAELKQFSSDFQLTDNKDESNKPEQPLDAGKEKTNLDAEIDKASVTLKKSTLNPNAKEFVFNPQQKPTSYARSPNPQTPTPPRPHTPSTAMAQPPTMQMMPQSQAIYNLHPQYMMPAPVSVSLNPTFNPSPMQQTPRMRKGGWGVPTSVHQQRHEFSQVAAATGQPLLAPATIPGHFVQYVPQSMVHTQGQATMPYPQVYSVVGPRMGGPQHISMVSTSHAGSYGDNQHIANQVFVSPHPMPQGPNPNHHGATSLQSMTAGPHQNPPGSQQGPQMAGQTQAAGVHPSPSPVHQPPPPQPTPPSTVGAQQPMVYQPQHAAQLTQQQLQHSPHTPNSPQTQMHQSQSSNPHMGQHPNAHLHPNSHSSNAHGGQGGGGQGGPPPPHMTQAHPQQHPGNAGGYPTAPGHHQQMVLIHQQGPTAGLAPHPQQVQPGGPQAYQGTLHGHGNPNAVAHIMSHSSMTMPTVIPVTSGAATMTTHPHPHIYLPHVTLATVRPRPVNAAGSIQQHQAGLVRQGKQ